MTPFLIKNVKHVQCACVCGPEMNFLHATMYPHELNLVQSKNELNGPIRITMKPGYLVVTSSHFSCTGYVYERKVYTNGTMESS